MRCAALVGLVAFIPACFGQVFQGLGLAGSSSQSIARAISSDGSTVVGGSAAVAWRWTQSGGLQPFANAPAGFTLNYASDVSTDGSVVVGSMANGVDTFAWRWSSSSGIEQVSGVGGAFEGPFISGDGLTIVGRTVGALSGVRWTQATGVQSLGPVTGLPFGNGSTNVAYGVSANGSVIVGPAGATYQLNPPLSTIVPYRWTQATGAVGILNNGQFYNPADGAGATSVSDDGSVIAGISFRSAWVWRASTGFQSIVLNPPPIGGSYNASISGDGLTIAYREFLWTESNGTQLLTDVLTSAGCNFTGWTNLRVIDTSFNGRTLCGFGTNPAGQFEAWYATIPTPSTAALLGLCGSAFALRRRRWVCQPELA